MDIRKQKKSQLKTNNNNTKFNFQEYNKNKQYFDFLRLIDTILAVREKVKLLGQSDNDVYGAWGGYYGGFNTFYGNRYEYDSKIDDLNDTIDRLFDEIQEQMENNISIQDIKDVLDGIKEVLVDKINDGRSRKWRKWHESASVQTVYQGRLDNWFDDYSSRVRTEKPTKAVVSVTTSEAKYTYRPAKTLKWQLVFRPEIATFIKRMMYHYKHEEWGIAFTWTMDKEAKQLIVDRMYIMPVDTGGAHVKFVNESEFVIFSELSELGEFVKDIDNETRFAGIMHSHHTMGSWHSSIDHGTIATYINDFNSVLSLVWSYRDVGSLNADIILKSKKDGYIIPFDNVIMEQDLDIESEELREVESTLFNRYNEMIDIVAKDYDRYKKILALFDKTKKYLPIKDLYTQITDDENKCITKETLQKIIQI